MKTILQYCVAVGAIYIIAGIVSVAYIALHYRSFVKENHIRRDVQPFGIKTAAVYVLLTLLSVIFWPVALLFYKFAEQEELDRANGAIPELGIRPWR